MWRPKGSVFKKFYTAVILHHVYVVHLGLQDLATAPDTAGFDHVEQLDTDILTIRSSYRLHSGGYTSTSSIFLSPILKFSLLDLYIAVVSFGL